MSQALPLEERFPKEMADSYRTAFKHHLINNKSDYMSFISTYFAYLVQVEGDNGLSQPIHLPRYKTVLELLEGNQMMQHSEDQSLTLLEGVAIITWRERVEQFIQKYIEEQFEEYFFHNSTNPLNLAPLLTNEELIDKSKKQAVLNHIIGVIGMAFFEKLESDLQTQIYRLNPSFLYRRGEKGAKKLMEEAKQVIASMEEDFQGLSASIERTNRLWERVRETYLVTYYETFPKGKVDIKLYQSKVEPILQRLKTYDVSEAEVREMAMMDTVFTPETMKALIRFSYA